jgi:hypothetical protein
MENAMKSRFRAVGRRTRAGVLLLVMAVAGGAAGHAVTARRAAACSCAPFAWTVKLRSVTSSAPASNHQMYWPAQGTLIAYPGHADIWGETQEPGVIARVKAGR